MKCVDCLAEIKEGEYFDIENACHSCRNIRKHTDRCWVCGVRLSENNILFSKEDGQREPACISCIKKFEEFPEAEILCPNCSTKLEQDHENLYELWCPKCVEKTMLLESIGKLESDR